MLLSVLVGSVVIGAAVLVATAPGEKEVESFVAFLMLFAALLLGGVAALAFPYPGIAGALLLVVGFPLLVHFLSGDDPTVAELVVIGTPILTLVLSGGLFVVDWLRGTPSRASSRRVE